MDNYWDEFNRLRVNQLPFVQVTMVDARGSAPQDTGARAIVTSNGLHQGTVGGGKVEAHCIQYAQDLLKSSRESKKLETWNLQRDIGMTCGGEVSFFFETFNHKVWDIHIFGAGHVAQALIPLLLTLDCKITCIDNRDEWTQRLPNNPKLTIKTPAKLESAVDDLSSTSFVISMTRGHATDLPILKEIHDRGLSLPYLGVIGSEKKANTFRRELRELSVSDSFIEQILCPIGLPIGGNQPPEIAVSIVAQLLEFRDKSR